MIFASLNINCKKFIYTLQLIIFALSLFTFYSCSEDSVVNNNNNEILVVDSNFFSWSYVPVPGWNFYDSYIADTNSIFYVLDEKVFYYNGKASIQIDLGVPGEALCLDGIGLNLLYVGGRNTDNNEYSPFLKKWTGAVFEDIPLPLDSNDQVLDVCVENANSVWFAGVNGKIYNYDGFIVTSRFLLIPEINSSIYYPRLFLKDNMLFFYTEGYRNNSTYSYVYKLVNNDWVLVNADTINNGLVFSGMQLITFGNFAVRKAPGYLMEFNNQNWTSFVNTPTFEAYSLSGNSLTDFLCIGIPEGTLEFFPYYYNGEKWFKQDRAIPENIFYGFPVELKYCKGVYYGFYYAIELISHNYILVGKMNTPPGK